ncbi:MAG: hypothetical protein J6T55_01765 [Alphaproteobacteria bacterium]|nr:hypothetical protein [Alphaproteobacteria bacterium]
MTEEKNKAELPQRLAQASVEGLAIEVIANTIAPGTGTAITALKGVSGLKKAAKIIGKNSAKEALEDDDDDKNKIEELSGDLAIRLLDRSR